MTDMTNQEFEDIRPYTDQEIPAAMERIATSSALPLLASYVCPDRTFDEVRAMLRSFNTIEDFQMGVMYHANEQIIANSITSFTCTGIDRLDPATPYLFVSNHRDIMLDASLLQNVLVDAGHKSSQITFGANLMMNPVVIDIGKSNKMFRVERPGGSIKEFYKSSLHLSRYIRHAITEQRESVWIAQRNGRTKDGIDRTDQGIIKMFGMSRTDNKVESINELHIVPVAVSYEWESCDILKTIELYEKQRGPYIKKPGEDLNSILTGIAQPKGRVHIEFCKPLERDELQAFSDLTAGDFHKQVATLIDHRICTSYRLTPNNYIAHDIRYGNMEYADRYTPEEKKAFKDYMHKLSRYEEDCDIDQLFDIFLGIYSNPIDSKRLFSRHGA